MLGGVQLRVGDNVCVIHFWVSKMGGRGFIQLKYVYKLDTHENCARISSQAKNIGGIGA